MILVLLCVSAGFQFDLSKNQLGRAPKGGETRCTSHHRWTMPPPNNFFFILKIVRSGAFSYTTAKVLFAIKFIGRYVITVYSWRLTVIQTRKRQVVINLVNLSPSCQSVATRIGMCYRRKLALYQLQTQAKL